MSAYREIGMAASSRRLGAGADVPSSSPCLSIAGVARAESVRPVLRALPVLRACPSAQIRLSWSRPKPDTPLAEFQT